MLEFMGYLVDLAEDLLIWLSGKQVKAAKMRLHVLKEYHYQILKEKDLLEQDLAELEQEEIAVQNEIILLQDYINTPAKEL